MELVRNKEEWDKIEPTLLKRYNMPFGEVRGIPRVFPCLFKVFPCTDANGYNLHVVTVTRKECQILIDLDGEFKNI